METTTVDLSWESHIPLSALRSTASPCKKRPRPSPFSSYLSQLALTNITNGINVTGSHLKLSSPPLRESGQPSPLTDAFDASRSSDADSRHIQEYPEAQSDCENASQQSPTTLSSPLAVPSSPSSAAGDISTALDFCQDDDAMTDIDLPECAILQYSPFSSPLSTAPNSPTLIHVAIIPPEASFPPLATTVHSERPKKSRRASQSSEVSSEFDATSKLGNTGQKRARSPSPALSLKPYRRSRSDMTTKERKADAKPSYRSKASLDKLSPRSAKSSKDLIGPLVQILALSGKSSMPTSSIIQDLLDSTPALRSDRTVEDWTALAVRTMATYPIFGQAERKGLKVSWDACWAMFLCLVCSAECG